MLGPIGYAAILATGLALAGPAQAAVCRGEAPAGIVEIRGPVLHVPDSEHICVALSPDPSDWVEVRVIEGGLADRPDPSHGALMAASFGQDVTCRFMQTPSGAAGVCRTAKGDVARLVTSPRILKTAHAWR